MLGSSDRQHRTGPPAPSSALFRLLDGTGFDPGALFARAWHTDPSGGAPLSHLKGQVNARPGALVDRWHYFPKTPAWQEPAGGGLLLQPVSRRGRGPHRSGPRWIACTFWGTIHLSPPGRLWGSAAGVEVPACSRCQKHQKQECLQIT